MIVLVFILKRSLIGLYYITILNVIFRAESSVEVKLGPRDLPRVNILNRFDFDDHCITTKCELCNFYKKTEVGWRCCEFKTAVDRLLRLFPIKNDN